MRSRFWIATALIMGLGVAQFFYLMGRNDNPTLLDTLQKPDSVARAIRTMPPIRQESPTANPISQAKSESPKEQFKAKLEELNSTYTQFCGRIDQVREEIRSTDEKIKDLQDRFRDGNTSQDLVADFNELKITSLSLRTVYVLCLRDQAAESIKRVASAEDRAID